MFLCCKSERKRVLFFGAFLFKRKQKRIEVDHKLKMVDQNILAKVHISAEWEG